MHELTVTREIVNIALHRGEEVGAERITSVSLRIGEFTAVEPDCVRLYFDMLTEGTPAAGAALEVEMTPLAAKCSGCGAPFVPERVSFRCPACGCAEAEITSGRELYVQSIEVR